MNSSRKVFLYSDISPSATVTSLSLFGRKADHTVGAMVWGRESTAVYLFASSEPPGDKDFTGFHKGFDVKAQEVAFDFDASEAGDAISITQDGQGVSFAGRRLPFSTNSVSSFRCIASSLYTWNRKVSYNAII
jgi:hypothetical protein